MRPRRPEPVTFECSCGAGPFKLYLCTDCRCSQCGTHYALHDEGSLVVGELFWDDVKKRHSSPAPSHAQNVDWPA